MNRSELSICALILMGIGSIAPLPARPEATGALPVPAAASPPTIVLHGSGSTAEPSLTANDDLPVVLRGSPLRAAPPPAAEYACLGADASDLRPGCIPPDYLAAPNDYEYWPYYGLDGVSLGQGRRAVRHAFTRRIGPGLVPRFDHRLAKGLGAGHSHAGFAQRWSASPTLR